VKPSRIALAYIACSVLALALFATPLWYGWRVNVGTLRVFVPEDMQALPELFNREGVDAVAAAVRSRSDPTGNEVVVFASPTKEVIAGTLRRWPAEIPDPPGTYGHVISLGNDSSMRVVVTHFALPGGYHLLVGRQSAGLMSLQGLFGYGMSGALTIVMGLGAALAWLLARRATAARYSEERYALAMRAAGDGHTDWDLKTNEHYISPRLLQICGFAPGTTFRDRDEWMRRFPFHPDDRQRWEQAVAAHFAGCEPTFQMDLRIVVRDEVRWTAFHFLSTRDAAGTPIRWTGSIGDISVKKRTEEALRETQERYALAVAGSNDGIWDWDLATNKMFVSERAQRIFGCDLGQTERLREEWHNMIDFHPDDHAAQRRMVDNYLAGAVPNNEGEWRVRGSDGVYRWIRIRSICQRNSAGEALRMAGSVSDIDAQKKAEAALRESEERFALAVAGSNDGVWDVNFSDRRVFFSARARELSGQSPGPEIMTLEDYFSDIPLHPDDASRRLTALQEHLAGNSPSYEGEFRVRQLDGEYRWRRIHGLCVRDAEGNPHRMAGSISDVDSRRRAEDALRLSEASLKEAQRLAQMGNFSWHVREGSIAWSEQVYRIFEFEPGSCVSLERIAGRVHPDDMAMLGDMVERAQRGEDEFEYEHRVEMMDGRIKHIHLIARRSSREDRLEYVGAIQDITQRKRAEEELRKMEQALRSAQRLEAIGTLAGGIAHDFNNILGAILGYCEMAVGDADSGTRLRRDLDSIYAAGERGRALVDRILAFSPSGVGERVPVHVQAVVQEALDQVCATLPANVTIGPARLLAGRAAMLGDSTQVHQVIMNLASNAVQAMPRGGVLGVELDAVRVDEARPATLGSIVAGDYLVVTVSDTGDGIPPAVFERMFDPFFTTKEVGVGSGLGLSLVHGIVTNVGGAIDVDTRPGKGTRFTVYLRRSGDAPEKVADDGQPLVRGEGQCVLVVDDEEALVRLATETLKRLSYEPLGFTSSPAALAAFRADPSRFDAVLTDERMPGLSGSALIREIRAIREAIPIVLMSGYLGMESIDADVVLKKPFSARDVAESEARVLRS